MSQTDSLDNRILGAIQSNFPVDERPFRIIAEKIGESEETVIDRVKSLFESKVIRRFGAVFDSRRLGYVSTLVGVRIPDPEHLPAVARHVSRYPEVTHNYERADSYNLWFTLIAENPGRIAVILQQVRGLPGVAEVRDLPQVELYKINASFKPLEPGAGGSDE